MLKTFKKGFAVLTTAFLLSSLLPSMVMASSSTDPATIRQLFTGKFAGSDPTVSRIGGADRYETAAKMAQQGWENGSSEYAVLSAGMDENLVDALTAAPLASSLAAPILLTEGEKLNSHAKAELERLGVTTVYITSGTGVIKQAVIDELKAMDMEIINLGGESRFETAINIAEKIGDFDEVIISTAWSNADALSVASLAAHEGIPILLSDADKLPAEVATFLGSSDREVYMSYILGGEGALSKAVEEAVEDRTDSLTIRLGGQDRYETNVEILDAFKVSIEMDKVYMASGNDQNLVDALAGAPLAAKTASAMVLLDQNGVSEKTRDFVKDNIFPLTQDNVVALGGEAVVPTALVRQLSSVEKYTEDKMAVGSDTAERLQLEDNVVVLGDEITLTNLTAPYNIYVEGNDVVLNNVNAGTVIINPGETGKITLKNVNAEAIMVLSGAEDGIILDNSMAKLLVTASSNPAGVVLKGNSTLEMTVISSDAILDAQNGDFGKVAAGNPMELIPQFELKGEYTQPVVMTDGSISTGEGTVIPNLIILPSDSKEVIRIKGNFNVIQISDACVVTIESGSVVDNLIYSPDAEVEIEEGAIVKNKSNI